MTNNLPWKPLATAPLKTLVLVRGESGYKRFPEFIVSAYCDPEGYPQDSWRFPSGDALSECGWKPVLWSESDLAPVRLDSRRALVTALATLASVHNRTAHAPQLPIRSHLERFIPALHDYLKTLDPRDDHHV